MDNDAPSRAPVKTLHASQDVFATVEHLSLITRKVAAQFQAHLNSLQALVSKRRNDVENRRLEARQWDKGEHVGRARWEVSVAGSGAEQENHLPPMEDVLRDVATLTRRRQVLEERNHANEERVAAVSCVCIQKKELLERHTQASKVCAPLQKIWPSLEQSLDLFAKWAGLRLILVPAMLDRQCSLLNSRCKECTALRPYRVWQDVVGRGAVPEAVLFAGQGYRICLTLLDPRQPHKCCSFLLGIDSKKSYIVSECSPAVPNLDALVDQLRQTCELSRFVWNLRQHFKMLLLAHPTECAAASLDTACAQVAS